MGGNGTAGQGFRPQASMLPNQAQAPNYAPPMGATQPGAMPMQNPGLPAGGAPAMSAQPNMGAPSFSGGFPGSAAPPPFSGAMPNGNALPPNMPQFTNGFPGQMQQNAGPGLTGYAPPAQMQGQGIPPNILAFLQGHR